MPDDKDKDKDKDAIPVGWLPPSPVDRRYRLVRHWSIREAEHYYAVYRYSLWPDGTTVFQVGKGGETWAKLNAEQLGIEIEDEDTVDGDF